MSSQSIEAGGAGKATFGSYLTGFVLAVILTLIAFALVMSGALPRPVAVGAIFAAAVAQIIVHLHYFLHPDRSAEQRRNVLALAFTAVVLLIVVGGSIWIMLSLHTRTMLG